MKDFNNNLNKMPKNQKQAAKQQSEAEKKRKLEEESSSSSSDSSDSEDEMPLTKTKISNKMVAMEYKLKGSSVPQYLFYKQHNGALPSSSGNEKKDTKNDRTKGHILFCSNISPFAQDQSLSEMFSKTFDTQVGQCVMSHLEEKHDSIQGWLEYKNPFSIYKDTPTLKSGTAHILLNKASAVQKALEKESVKAKEELNTENLKFGLERYKEEYKAIQFPSDAKEKQAIKQEITQWMKDFDIKERERMRVIHTLRNKADDKGWTKVFHRGNQGPIHASELKIKKKHKKTSNKTKHNLDMPFYKFQKVEKKKKAFEELRDQFERDKELIEKMKRQKKFESVNKSE